MINQFKQNQPNVILIIAFVGVLLWAPLFIYSPGQLQVNYHFSGAINSLYLFLNNNYGLKNVFSFLLVCVISLLLSRLNTRFLFINFRTQMPGYWFILLTGPFAYIYDIFPLLVAIVFLVFSLHKLFESYDKKKGISYELVDAGFMISLGSFFYPPILFFHLFLFGSLLILRSYSLKEWFLVIIGGIMPFAIGLSISYVFDITFQQGFNELFNNYRNAQSLHVGNRIFAGCVGTVLFFASIQMIRVFSLKKIYSRRLFSTFFLLFVITILVVIFTNKISLLLIGIVPITYLFTHYFYLIKKSKAGVFLFYSILIITFISIAYTLFPTTLRF